jgi:hypothetical protein
LRSDYCQVETKRALERRALGKAIVIPVVIEPCDWMATPIRELQCLPRDGKAISSREDRGEAFAEVAREIRERVENFGKLECVNVAPPPIHTSDRTMGGDELTPDSLQVGSGSVHPRPKRVPFGMTSFLVGVVAGVAPMALLVPAGGLGDVSFASPNPPKISQQTAAAKLSPKKEVALSPFDASRRDELGRPLLKPSEAAPAISISSINPLAGPSPGPSQDPKSGGIGDGEMGAARLSPKRVLAPPTIRARGQDEIEKPALDTPEANPATDASKISPLAKDSIRPSQDARSGEGGDGELASVLEGVDPPGGGLQEVRPNPDKAPTSSASTKPRNRGVSSRDDFPRLPKIEGLSGLWEAVTRTSSKQEEVGKNANEPQVAPVVSSVLKMTDNVESELEYTDNKSNVSGSSNSVQIIDMSRNTRSKIKATIDDHRKVEIKHK